MIVKYYDFLIVGLNVVFWIQTSVLRFTSLNLTICMRLEQRKTANVCCTDIGSERMKKNHVVYKMILKYKKSLSFDARFSIENWKKNLNSIFIKFIREK